MKKLIILLLLTYTTMAQETLLTLPVQLKTKLCKLLAQNTNRCENGSTIDYYKHLTLSNDKLLVFVTLNEHSLSFGETNPAVPLLVNNIGQWELSQGDNSINEDIESIHEDPHGNIWVRAMWHSEGVYPALYHSSDAIHWKHTILPKNRDVDCCFETVDVPIFKENTIKLTFRDLENKRVKSWLSSYKSAMSSKPKWKPIQNSSISVSLEKHSPSNWKITQNSTHITFLNERSKYTFFLPLSENKHKHLYHVQVGAFLKMSSAKIVIDSLKNMPYTPYLKTSLVKGRQFIKLLIGDFTSKRKAKFILNKLKKEHQNNPMFQKAFIFSSKV